MEAVQQINKQNSEKIETNLAKFYLKIHHRLKKCTKELKQRKGEKL